MQNMRCRSRLQRRIFLLQKYKIFLKAQNKKPPTRERNQALGSSRSAVLQGSEKDGTGFDESTNVPHCNAAYLRRKTESNRY